ncbi:PIN domain-containing protein [Microbacterium sp. NPDC055910]|uniref:PIN domain-containing protein n=1 Tax=Microbacterium sp. NPDC055910 TaxID=3345659 RepID=UPI0035D8D534
MLQRVFVDSNVLASRTQYDWLFMLRNETDSMFQLHSSFDVLVEAVRVWRRRNPTARGASSKRRFDHLLANLDEVVDDFDADIDFDGEDPGDIHVNAAAVASGAHKLLTMNGRDFGDPDLLQYEIYRPDQFFCLVDDGADACVRRVTMEQVNYWKRQRERGRSTKPLADALRDAGCPTFATRVSRHLRVLGGQ